MKDLARRHRLVETGQQVLGKDTRSAPLCRFLEHWTVLLLKRLGACPASLRGAGALCLARVLEHDSQSGQESAGCLACGQVMPRFGPTSAAQAVGHLFQDGISCLTCNALIPEVPAAHGCWCKGVRNYAVAGVVLMLKR